MSSRRNKTSGLSGFVSFMKRRDAEEALRELDGFDWGGSVLRVGWSKAVPVGTRAMYSKCFLRWVPAHSQRHSVFKPTLRRATDDAPSPGLVLVTEVEIGTEKGTTEAGLVLDPVASTNVGGVGPVRTAQLALGRPGGGTIGTETVRVIATERDQDPTVGRALLKEIGTGGTLETQTKRNCSVMTTSLRSLFELLLWKSKAGVKITNSR